MQTHISHFKIFIDSPSTDQNRQSLAEAREPPTEIISKASFLRSQGMSNENQVFEYKDNQYPDHQIMNLQTSNYSTAFAKKLSSPKSTFLDEREEADLQNVNEFSEYEEYHTAHINVDKLITHKDFKLLPVTKESFIVWQKQSMLKSFATSHEESYIGR